MANKLSFSSAKKLNALTFQPQVQTAFSGWEEQVVYKINKQTVVEGDAVNELIPLNFQGVIQPLTTKELKLKPEGERAWKWMQIHARTQLDLNTNDRIVIGSDTFKVMADKDYSRNGYFEYHAVEDYTVT